MGLERPVAAGCKAAMRQRVGQDVADRLFELAVAGKVPAVVSGVAPDPVLRPVPRRHAKFRVVPIADRPPARREGLLQNVRRKYLVNICARQHIDGTAQCLVGVEGVNRVARCSVHTQSCRRLLGRLGHRNQRGHATQQGNRRSPLRQTRAQQYKYRSQVITLPVLESYAVESLWGQA